MRIKQSSGAKNTRNHLDRWHGKEELSVEATRPAQCGVDGVDLVGRPDDDDLAAIVQPIHEREQSRHDRAVDLVLATRPHRSEAVDLVEEDDGRTREVGLKALRLVGLHITSPYRDTQQTQDVFIS